MKSKRKKLFFENIFRLLLSSTVIILFIFGNMKNVNAETLLIENFPKESIVELLKLDVPKKLKLVWINAEKKTWEPWLLKQEGFLGRQLFWDPRREEATLLIGWESKSVWKSISQSEINFVQQEFEKIARMGTGQTNGNPFPLVYEGELNPQ